MHDVDASNESWIERNHGSRQAQGERHMSKSLSSISSLTRRSVQVLIASLAPMLVWAGPVDINKADAATIAKELQGVGLSKAQAIVAYREKNGSFKTAEDLRKVKGIGAKTLDRNRPNIRVDASAPEKKAG
ncbi:MAG: ComEA family DNA-binding protein [Povalibacter sp.]